MSPLALRAQEYLALRRSLGHKLEEHERRLLSLVEHLEQTGNTPARSMPSPATHVSAIASSRGRRRPASSSQPSALS
jgi:hypothetical protein